MPFEMPLNTQIIGIIMQPKALVPEKYAHKIYGKKDKKLLKVYFAKLKVSFCTRLCLNKFWEMLNKAPPVLEAEITPIM